MRLGAYELDGAVVLAPMAGLADAPFRSVCLACGAALAVGEMVACDATLRETAKTRRRFQAQRTESLAVTQLLGADPQAMAEAARYAVRSGAKVVDINFGCPVRTVCGKACGSALMADEVLAVRLLQTVRDAVDVPLTVKMRTGWDAAHKNVVALAKAAEQIGFCAVAVHARTREQRFAGAVDLETLARVVDAVSIPVIANGDIDSPERALAVVQKTGAAAVMVGRAARGSPWLLGQIDDVLARRPVRVVTPEQRMRVILGHFDAHLRYWGEGFGALRSFRKHLLWYLSGYEGGSEVARQVFRLSEPAAVREALMHFLMDNHGLVEKR